MDLVKYKKYLQQKKLAFVNTSNKPNIYGGVKKGEQYGYHLEEPYSAEELNELTTKYNIKLPEQLSEYLTQVSKDFFVSSYPHKFGVYKMCQTTIDIDLEKNIWENTFYDSESEEEDIQKIIDRGDTTRNGLLNVSVFMDNLIRIGNNGCVFNDEICVALGPNFGTCWSYFDDFNWSKISQDLFGYLITGDYKEWLQENNLGSPYTEEKEKEIKKEKMIESMKAKEYSEEIISQFLKYLK